MKRHHWAAILLVAALVAIAAFLHPCDAATELTRTTPHAATATDAPPPANAETAKPRHRAGPTEAPPKPADGDAPATAAAHATVVVHVVAAEDKTPIAGADVVLVEGDPYDQSSPQHRGRTDDAGVARFDVPVGEVSARASAPDWVRSDWTDGTAEAAKELSLEIALDRGVLLEGVVIDSTSARPIPGATVDVALGGLIVGLGDLGTDAPPLGRITTGADGRFRLRVPANQMVTPTASARGYAADCRTVIVPAGEVPRPPMELRLEPSGTMRGTVRSPDGAPIAGAKVYAIPAHAPDLLSDPDGWIDQQGKRWTSIVAKTDADGRYEMDGLSRGGAYVAFAVADDWARSVRREGVLATEAAPAVEVDFALRRFGRLVVHVVDADGAPVVANVVLFAVAQSENTPDTAPRAVRPDVASNTTCFDRLAPGVYRACVDSTAVTPAAFDDAVEVLADRATEITLRLERASVIDGVVVDDRGAPIAGARVHASDPGNPNGHAHIDTDDLGRFRLAGIRAGPHDVSVLVGHQETGLRKTIVAPNEDVRITIIRSASVKLHVARAADSPWGTEIVLRREGLDRMVREGDFHRGGRHGESRLVFHEFEPGACRIRITAEGYAPVTRLVDLKPGETLDLGDVVFDPGIDLVGRVEDAAGAPVVGAQVTTGETSIPEFKNASTGADGSFRLAHFAAGMVHLQIVAPDFVTAYVDAPVAAGGAPFVVRLVRGGLLRVTVVDAAGAPVPGADALVRPADEPESYPYPIDIDHRGIGEKRLAAGKWRVTVEGREGAADAELVDGGATAVRVVVK